MTQSFMRGQNSAAGATTSVAKREVPAMGRPLRAKTLGPWRLECRERAARIMATAIQASTQQSVADSLNVHRSAVGQWCDPQHSAALTVGDLMAMPPAVAETAAIAVLEFIRARAEGAAVVRIGLERRARRATVAHGRVMSAIDEALADGVVDADEAREIVRATNEERAAIDALVSEVTGEGGTP